MTEYTALALFDCQTFSFDNKIVDLVSAQVVVLDPN